MFRVLQSLANVSKVLHTTRHCGLGKAALRDHLLPSDIARERKYLVVLGQEVRDVPVKVRKPWSMRSVTVAWQNQKHKSIRIILLQI